MLILAFVTATLFPKPRMDYDTVSGGSLLIGAIFFSLLQFLFDGAEEFNCLWSPQPTHSRQWQNDGRVRVDVTNLALPLALVQYHWLLQRCFRDLLQ